MKLRYLLLAWLYALMTKKPQRCKDCRYYGRIPISYSKGIGVIKGDTCFHNQAAAAHNPVKMINGRCKGFKRIKRKT